MKPLDETLIDVIRRYWYRFASHRGNSRQVARWLWRGDEKERRGWLARMARIVQRRRQNEPLGDL